MEAVGSGDLTLAVKWLHSFTCWLRAALVLFLSLLFSACSSIDSRPYPWFQRLEILSATATAETDPARTTGDLATRGVSAGVIASVGAGLTVSLICGPWYLECASAMLPDLMASGAATGTLAGLAGLSPEEAAQVNTYFNTLPARRNLNTDMVAAVSALIPTQRLAKTDADARLTLGIDNIRIIQEVKGEDLSSAFSLQLELDAQLAWDDGKGNPDRARRRFECATETRAAAHWLENNSHHLDTAVDGCVKRLAAEVNNALAAGDSAATTRLPAADPGAAMHPVDHN